MPKKHQQKALLTKPQSSTPHTLSPSSSSKSGSRNQDESTQRTVNDLIRESRRLQLRNEPRNSSNLNATASLPPSLRAVLDLPAPPPPAPRIIGAVTRSSQHGPSRVRRIPGPPPPRSWLTDSIHAPRNYVDDKFDSLTTDAEEKSGRRLQVRSSNLPDAAFPPSDSLQHLVLKKIASNWEWHAAHEHDYLGLLPTNLKETLLSFIAVFNEGSTNPLRILFFADTDPEDRTEVGRLDLSNGLGSWTTFKQLERDLLARRAAPPATPTMNPGPVMETASSSAAPDSWDAEDEGDEDFARSVINAGPQIRPNFVNLKHLSLAISPVNIRAASWSSLLAVAGNLRTLTSLSLAYWPQPTFTPLAASTRATIQAPGPVPVVYGGSDMYTMYDNNWREAAGILRTLSRSLYCLKWLDLTGCGEWFGALEWSPSISESSSERLGPEWNGGWRGVETLILEVGWKPIAPAIDSSHVEPDEPSWNVENERKLYRYNKERQKFTEIRSNAQSVARYLRSLRKDVGGRWIEVECGTDLAS